MTAQGDANVRQAIDELSTLRAKVSESKIPLARNLDTLEQEVISLRKEAGRVQGARDSLGVNLEMLKNEVKTRNEELDYLSNLLAEYARSLKVRMNVSEFQLYEEPIMKTLDVLTLADADDGTILDTLSESIDLGLDRAGEVIGGRVFKGSAITESGNYAGGQFVLLGPLAYFCTADGIGGLVENGDTAQPRVDFISKAAGAQILAVVTNKGGPLPIDSTMGNALAIAATKDSLAEHIGKGGIWVYPIIGFAAISLLMGIIKGIDIYSTKVIPFSAVNDVVALLRDKGVPEARHYINALEGPGAEMLKQGVAAASEDRETVEEILSESVLRIQPKLERMLPFISMTAAISPLLGLLGTVTGMINTFNLITVFGTGDAKTLSSGISEALITTEFGLIVAIPALVLHAILSRRVHGILATLESQAISFVNGTGFMRK